MSTEADKLIPVMQQMREALSIARQQLVTLGGDLPSDPNEKIYGDAIHAAVLSIVDKAIELAEASR